MRSYSVELEGLTPMLMHFDNIEAQDEINAKGRTGGKAGDDRYPADTWKTYLYLNDKAVVIPAANLLSSLLKVGGSISIGGKKTLKAASQSLFFSNVYLHFKNGGKTIERGPVEAIKGEFKGQREQVDKLGFALLLAPCRVNGKRHVRVRPMFNQWTVSGDFQTDDPDLTLDRLKQLFSLAGMRAGLGDWRPGSPSKPGPYGRFKATVIEG